MDDKILHFGVWIKKSDRNRICRENYAVINKKNSAWSSRLQFYFAPEERKKYYDDEECRIYSDSYCEEHQEKCLINYDKNMAFFAHISNDEFENALQKLIASDKRIRQIFDLNDCNHLSGVYVMVLGDYKQVYIGQSHDMKRRIMNHWSRQKSFDRLLCGKVNDSVLSIDSFGALDTTRIFVLETDDLDYCEIKLQKKISPCFKLNRMAGGVPEDKLDLISKVLDRDSRNLKDFHNEEFAEQYEKELTVFCFVPQDYCRPEELAEGDIVCLERTNRGKKLPTKYFGQVIKATKSRLLVYRYCSSILGYSCPKSKRMPKEEIRIKKTMLFSKVAVEEKTEIHTFWRSKKFPHIEA